MKVGDYIEVTKHNGGIVKPGLCGVINEKLNWKENGHCVFSMITAQDNPTTSYGWLITSDKAKIIHRF